MTRSVTTRARWFAAALIGLVLAVVAQASAVSAATSEVFSSDALSARLLTAEDGVADGATSISAGLELELAEGWKTYWRSPGEVGLPPTLTWDGSENVSEVDFYWPAPKRFRAFGIENFGYQTKVVFPLRIVLKDPGQPVDLSANVNLLVCYEVCIPLDFDLSLALPSGSGIDAASAGLISEFSNKIPDDGRASGMSVETATLAEDLSSLIVTARSSAGFEAPDIFPELGAEVAFGSPDIRLGEGGRLLWAKLPILSAGELRPNLGVTITDGARAASFEPALSAEAPAPPFDLGRVAPRAAELAWITLIALIGGLILNVMPCVLPVLSIKLSSALKSHDQTRARIRGGFLMSALGVVSFMWLLAGATVLARQLGLSVGWGLQFQSPAFLAVMILILTIFAANFFGAFEIALPSSWQNRIARADGVAGKRAGYSGDFATGAFAAVLATPCSAPFLGTAVAFALAGRPVDIFVIFTALGVGLAIPYFMIAAAPGMVHRLPRPGRWMAWLKLVLGGLLLLTAAWLFWVLSGVAGQSAMLVVGFGAGAVILLLSKGRVVSQRLAIPLALAAAAVAIVSPQFLVSKNTPDALLQTEWRVFERSEIPRLVSEGFTVFVDVTADWCLTCKANKALVLDRDPVASALAADEVIPMQADWTQPNEAIARYLEGHGRYGIPFNVVYGPGAPEGIILPELLSSEVVLDALNEARAQSIAMEN